MSAVFRTVTAQVADHLRTALMQGRWRGILPGRNLLANELGVNRKTVEAALRQLELDGILVNQGQGRGRRIELPAVPTAPSLRVAILLSEKADRSLDYIVNLRHQLREAGHAAFHPEKTLEELSMKPSRIARLMSAEPADAWIVLAASREVLEWFANRPVPAFALFGPMRGLRLAGAAPHKAPAFAAATRALLDLRHRRIALLVRPRRRVPAPGPPEQSFLAELKARGIEPAPYHLPDWAESAGDFHEMLDAMFRVTPPTALIVDEAPLFVAVLQFCTARRLRVPEDVSLICTDADPSFAWCRPGVAHIAWDSQPVVRRVLRWAGSISLGRNDTRQTFAAAKFVPGGTVGPAPAR
jgi:DNA-binding LacI/PurR family transcriptional regulator/DNA-binding transcriptional regulator YhcF (GntR family)